MTRPAPNPDQDIDVDSRYARQTSLPEIGPRGQARLAAARILCVGAGGLGSAALLYIAAAGIGRIGIAEFDAVSLSNLQRQVLYDTGCVGESKAFAAKRRLLALNPEIEISVHEARCAGPEADALMVRGWDMVVECTDSFEAKAQVCAAARRAGLPVVHAGIEGFVAQVTVFVPGGPCYRCLYPCAPPPRAQDGVMGAAAGIGGVVQASQAVLLAAGPHPGLRPLIGRLWQADMRTMATRVIGIPRDPGCAACGDCAP